MELIDKDRVMAEIEKLRKNAWESFQKGNSTEEQYYIRCGVIQDILASLDALEVKEVDLEKEVDTWRHNHFHGRRDKNAAGEYLERSSQLDIAKHFFELGLKVQKGE